MREAAGERASRALVRLPARLSPARLARARTSASLERRTELILGALAVGVLAFIAAMAVTVFAKAWPSFAHNGLKWFLPGGDVDQQLRDIENNTTGGGGHDYHLRAWPLLWGTIVTTGFAVLVGMALSILTAIFMVEFAPNALRRVMDPVVRLLAGVPSVLFGLIGILAIAPWVNRHLISQERKHSVAYVVQITGEDLGVAALILTLMIMPIMIAIVVSALESVPGAWKEGSAALGVNRWRTTLRISLRAARPAIVAAATLSTARALGESIMLLMVSGSRAFAANPADGLTFLFEPVRPLAATIIANIDRLSQPSLGSTLYAMAAVLLIAAALMSFSGWAMKQPMKRYGIRA